MNKFIPKEKMSKKLQQALNLARRKTWGALNPVTRKPEDPKVYNRKKVQKGVDDDYRFEPFLFIQFVKQFQIITAGKNPAICRYRIIQTTVTYT